MTTLNEDGPCVTWFVNANNSDLEDWDNWELRQIVPTQSEDFCPDCAKKLLAEIDKKFGPDHGIFLAGNSDCSISNESDCENICRECGTGIYTELIGDEED